MSDIDMQQHVTSSAPLFILSAPRSGSTLLRYIVDTHPEISCPGELVLGKLCAWLSKVVSRTTAQTAGLEANDTERFVAREVREIVQRQIMGRYASEKGKRMWCDKSPDNVAYVDVLSNVFPDARFICLYRTCMDVVSSCLEDGKFGFMPELTEHVRRHPDNLVRAMVDAWIERTEALVALESARPQACFRVHYEQLVADPGAVLEPMFRFIGVGWEPAWLDDVFSTPHDQGGGDWKINAAASIDAGRVGRGKWVRRGELPKHTLEQANRLLATLGYAALGAAEGDSPTAPVSRGSRSPASGSPSSLELRQVFEVFFRQRIAERAEALGAVAARFRFDLPGADPDVWTVDLTVPGGEIVPMAREADCTIRIEPTVLIDFARGIGDPLNAFAEGRILLDDERGLAPALLKILA